MALSKTVAQNAEVGRTGILDAAALLLGRQGYGAVSLRMIAEAAGIKAGDRVAALSADAPARDVFRAVLRGHLCALLEHGAYTSANVRIFGQVPPVVRDANLPVRRAYEAFLDNLLSELKVRDAIRSDVNLPRFRLLLIGALNATLEWFDPQKGSAEDLADDYADTFLNGILSQSGDNT